MSFSSFHDSSSSQFKKKWRGVVRVGGGVVVDVFRVFKEISGMRRVNETNGSQEIRFKELERMGLCCCGAKVKDLNCCRVEKSVMIAAGSDFRSNWFCWAMWWWCCWCWVGKKRVEEEEVDGDSRVVVACC